MVFLFSMIGRVGVVLYVLKRTDRFRNQLRQRPSTSLRRLDFRHRRANRDGAQKARFYQSKAKQSDGDYVPVSAFALLPA